MAVIFLHRSSSQQTRERIIDAAIDLYSKYGYTETSMRQVAEKAGIQVSSIYNHFSSKNDVLNAIFQEYEHWFNTNNTTREDALSYIRGLNGAKPSRSDLYDMLIIQYPDELSVRYRKILKIIYYESITNETFNTFLEFDSIEQYVILLRDILDSLIESETILPCDTSAISSLVFSAASACISLTALNLDVFDRFGGKNSMRDLMQYVLGLALDGNAN